MVVASPSRPALRASLLRKSLADGRLRAAAATVLGVSATDVLALQHLAWSGVLTPGALGSRLQLTSGGASALVRRLVRRGLVSCEAHPEDGRSTLLRLASGAGGDPAARGSEAAAEALLARTFAPLVRELDAAIAALDPVERAAVEQFVARVAEITEAHAGVLARSVEPERAPIEAVPHAGLWV